MATKEISDSQESHPFDLARANDRQTVTLRRLKKREVDRRCQREARERKRLRIADLERLVEDLRRQDANGQVAALLKQLKKVEAERDSVTKTLRDIQLLAVQKPLKLSDDEAEDHGSGNAQVISEDAHSRSLPHRNSLQENRLVSATPQPTLFDIGGGSASPSELATRMPNPNSRISQHSIRSRSELVQQCRPSSSDGTIVKSSGVGRQQSTSVCGKYGWVNPRNSCCCRTHVARQPGQQAVWQGNFWKFVTEVLSERLDWTEDIQPVNDAESEDVLVRAVLQGWDVVAGCAPLHPSLDMMRRIDEALFGPIPKPERLAMLRAMHLLIQFRTESNAERYKRLPAWYTYRPSHNVAHNYGIDYYAWPHFRQHAIFDEHAYCGNDFWYMYQSEMRLIWPYEFRDCYTHDLETGLYKPSHLFDERINDIKSWTMGPDFFQRFPELSSAIPSSGRQIPKQMPAIPGQMKRQLLLQPSTGSTKRGSSTNVGMVCETEVQQNELEDDDDWPGFHAQVSRNSSSIHGAQSQSNLPQSSNGQLCTFTSPLGCNGFLQSASDDSSSSFNGWYDVWGSDFDTSHIDTTTMNASIFQLAPNDTVHGQGTAPSGPPYIYTEF
ncbi:hypothetical protein B0A52_01312 [Exophiala mesophila]|uniref:BZIP domain-containing protein n=1 Tax=Exophiala mesophila TaxID=212818 RepID=A0A438NH29_EXOME|nr:hypothetical protein B0A52_01312 [Exophiala mesophila]